MLFTRVIDNPFIHPHVFILVSNTNYANESILSISGDIKKIISLIKDDIVREVKKVETISLETNSLFPDVTQEVLQDQKQTITKVYTRLIGMLETFGEYITDTSDVLFSLNRVLKDASSEFDRHKTLKDFVVKPKNYTVLVSQLD